MTDDDPDFAVIRRFNGIGHAEDDSALDELLTPDFVVHGGDKDIHGIDGWRAYLKEGQELYGPTEAGIDELIRTGELIGERWWVRAIPPDPTSAHGITMHRIVDGRIAEQWVVMHRDG